MNSIRANKTTFYRQSGNDIIKVILNKISVYSEWLRPYNQKDYAPGSP